MSSSPQSAPQLQLLLSMEQEDEFPGELRARIENAMASDSISPLARRLLPFLAKPSHLGMSLAVSISGIQSALGGTDREIKAAVYELIARFQIPIGSRREKPYGYFLVASDEDAKAAVGPLLAEIHTRAERIAVLSPKTSTYIRELLGQIRMELGVEG